MTPFAATAAISATPGERAALCARAIWAFRVGADRWGVIIAANYSGGARVLPPFLSQIHPPGLPAGEPAAALCARRTDPVARSVADARPRGGATGGAGGACEPPVVRAGGNARTHRAAASDSRRQRAARR